MIGKFCKLGLGGGRRLGNEVRILPNLGSGQRLHKSLFSSLWNSYALFEIWLTMMTGLEANRLVVGHYIIHYTLLYYILFTCMYM